MTLTRPALCFAVITALGLYPFDAMTENSRDFVEGVESKRTGRLCFYNLGPDSDDLKYLFHLPQEKRTGILRMHKDTSKSKKLFSRMFPRTRAAEEIPHLTENDMIVTIGKHYKALCALADAAGKEPVLVHQGELGHRKAVAVRLVPKQIRGK